MGELWTRVKAFMQSRNYRGIYGQLKLTLFSDESGTIDDSMRHTHIEFDTLDDLSEKLTKAGF